MIWEAGFFVGEWRLFDAIADRILNSYLAVCKNEYISGNQTLK